VSAASLILVGGGGHAAVVCDAARGAGWTVTGFLDDVAAPATTLAGMGVRRLGGVDDLERVLARPDADGLVHAAVGEADLRRRWLDRCPGRVAPAVVHPSAVVSPGATLAAGVFVGPRAVVNAGAEVGRGAIVNSGAVVEHDCRVGAFAHVAPGAILGGAVEVGAGTLVALGAVVRNGVRIGTEAVLGAGAVAVSDIPDGTRAFGVPARAAAEVAG
jgi:sugar O-acyltransferase (sialic acid O-acetyltransferase NeuD family)